MMFAKIIPIALANHLWQSTLIAVGAALLAFTLRKNRAQTRYALWLVASLKFLIPFSVLVAIGTRLKWAAAAPIARPTLSAAVQQISYPFTNSLVPPLVSHPAIPAAPSYLFPVILFAIWLSGFVAVLFSWLRRWLRLRAAVRAATRLPLQLPIQVLSSPALLEPGIFGITRPVLLLPEGITRRLAPEHLEAIFAHELCHVRRRDNLAAAVHMLVELVFWFHPLVWWIGARLIAERERACDEEVLRLGNQPQVYAESILKTCQFYLESPLACVSGVTGSDLKQRIVRIMTGRIANQLAFWKKFLLAASAISAVALPVAIGILNASPTPAQSQPSTNTAPTPSFEVASIKPDKSGGFGVALRIAPGGTFAADNVPLKLLIEEAYNVKDAQISGDPQWVSSEHFNLQAKPDEATAAQMQKMKPEERHQTLMLMLQSLLADRFQLKLSRSTKELLVYALVVAKNGPTIKKSDFVTPDKPPDALLPPLPPPGGGGPGPVMRAGGPQFKGGIMMMGPGHLNINGAPLERFADVLSRMLGRTVIDKTGLQGNYEFTLNWTPDANEGPLMPGGPPPGFNATTGGAAGSGPGGPGPVTAPPDTSGPNIFTAIQEQLGLKLESQKGPVELLVIDHVERPSEN